MAVLTLLFDGCGNQNTVLRLICQLENGQSYEKLAAAEKLGELGTQASGAIPALVRAVKGGDSTLAIEAGYALEKIGEASARYILEGEDADDQRLLVIVNAIGRPAIPHIMNALRNATSRTRKESMNKVLTVMGRRATPALPELEKMLSETSDQYDRFMLSVTIAGIRDGMAGMEKIRVEIENGTSELIRGRQNVR